MDLSLPLNRDERIGACPLLQLYRNKRHEKKCKCLTQKRRSRREVKKKPDWLEREKDTFSMSESKVTNFYLRLGKKYVFIISFIFDYIPFVIEISAPLRESPFCREPSVALSCRKHVLSITIIL